MPPSLITMRVRHIRLFIGEAQSDFATIYSRAPLPVSARVK
jgi:hypothetical protein